MSGSCIQCRIAGNESSCRHVGEINPDERTTLNRLLSEVIGTRYELLSRLGAGAFGDVFKALDTSLDRDVAIKRVRLDTFTDPANREEVKSRFIREAKLAARLNHPNIVTVYDIVDASTANFIIMEFVDGPTLQYELKRKKRLSLNETTAILAQAADALDHAHQHTIVHRDVTPANIMIESTGRVKMADFGTARSETSSNITTTGIILGTPNYMSPEQARGETTIDRRSDLFSLGCILYECLSGEKPFRADSQIATLMRIVNEKPPQLNCEDLNLHPGINDIMVQALAKDPKDRFNSATELIEVLEALPQLEVQRKVEPSPDDVEVQTETVESQTVKARAEQLEIKTERVASKREKLEPVAEQVKPEGKEAEAEKVEPQDEKAEPNAGPLTPLSAVASAKAEPSPKGRGNKEEGALFEAETEEVWAEMVEPKAEKVEAKPEKVEPKAGPLTPLPAVASAKAEPSPKGRGSKEEGALFEAETEEVWAEMVEPKAEKVEAKTGPLVEAEKVEPEAQKTEPETEKHEAEAEVEAKAEMAEPEGDKVELKDDKIELKDDKVELRADKVELEPDKVETKSEKPEKSDKGKAQTESGRAPLPVTRRDPSLESFFDDELQGDLKQKALAEVIRDLYANRKTGILHLQKEKTFKRIYFKKGSIVFANSDINDDRLGEFMIRRGDIDRKAFERASQVSKEIGQRFGRTLVELGHITEDKLEEKVIEQVLAIIYSLFDWVEGEYGFEQLEKPVEEDIIVRLSTADTILEGIRHMDSHDQVRAALGNLNRVLCHSDNPLLLYQKVSLTPEEGFVLSRVDGTITVAEAATISPLGENETLRCIYGLVAAGVLVLQEKETSRIGRMKRLEQEVVELPKPEAEIKEIKPEAKARSIKTGPASDAKAIHDEITAKHASLVTATHYELLEIAPTANNAEIKQAYYGLVKKYHPDRHHSPNLKDVHGLLEELVVKITTAYQVLSDSAERKRYDQVVIRDQSDSGKPEHESGLSYAAASGSSGGRSSSPGSVAEAHYREGKRRFDDMSYFDAIQCLQQAVQLDPNKAPYQALLAEALSKNPHWRKEAEEHYLKAIELDPANVECHLGLAAIYDNLGLSSRAKKMYNKVLKLDPGNETAHEKLNGSNKGGGVSGLQGLKNILKKKKA